VVDGKRFHMTKACSSYVTIDETLNRYSVPYNNVNYNAMTFFFLLFFIEIYRNILAYDI